MRHLKKRALLTEGKGRPNSFSVPDFALKMVESRLSRSSLSLSERPHCNITSWLGAAPLASESLLLSRSVAGLRLFP